MIKPTIGGRYPNLRTSSPEVCSDTMDIKRIDIIILLGIVIILITLVYIGFKLQSDGVECILDTEGYLIDKLEEANHANISCYCLSNRGTFAPYVFSSKT